MSKADRNQEVERLRGELEKVRHAFLIDYRGISVPQVTELRSQVRRSGGHYAVVKNTLLSRAVVGSALEKLKAQLKGPTAIAWSDKEPVALAKTLAAYAKTVPVLQFKAVLLDGEALPGDRVEAVASLPTRDELKARVVALLASPLRRFVTVVSAPPRNLASVARQRADKVKE